MKKKRGVYLSGIAGSAFMMIYVVALIYAYIFEGMPLGILLAFIVIPCGIIGCIIYVVKSRIKEIEGGEEDEAAQY